MKLEFIDKDLLVELPKWLVFIKKDDPTIEEDDEDTLPEAKLVAIYRDMVGNYRAYGIPGSFGSARTHAIQMAILIHFGTLEGVEAYLEDSLADAIAVADRLDSGIINPE